MKYPLNIMLIFTAVLMSGCQMLGQEEDPLTFPTDQISLVVPFASGGASDMVSRAVATQMEEELGVPVTVVNKTGGSGAIGIYDVMSAPPNGYRIGYVPVELAMYGGLELADIEPSEFEYLARLMAIPAAITVSADAPYDNIQEFIDYAEENPSQIQLGNSGTGSIWHIAGTALAQEMDVSFNYVPFEGAAPAVSSLMGGHIDAVSVSPSEIKSGLDSGDLKVLAVMGEERDPLVPDVPTLKEEGIDLVMSGWGGFVAPKGTPNEIVEAFNLAIENAMNEETFQSLASTRGLTPAYLPSKEFKNFAIDQYEYFNELIPTIRMNN
ncbi:tripartite tricarboxylate transporter substrate binding protein [Alkalicoccobacillus porphyridii]|uniref:Tripartite tricarboxylate transporter substrate binding protein n=1 Tax=Alkalicoccobacillus porphyridii TaxID=2597270 RepID=A0A554A416_9BACI|nr:tripartite tricarboxylate transporter substrate binding protein [Alkalicoccobacillus porphyridii]TSB48432.1 tripartite tricarboxylate transporter substrate binding protein [Alkalicoccobacillus porphyridii]